MVQNSRWSQYLIIIYVTNSKVSERVSRRMSAAERASLCKLCEAGKRVSGMRRTSGQVNGPSSGPVLTSGFLVLPNPSRMIMAWYHLKVHGATRIELASFTPSLVRDLVTRQ